MQIKRLESTHLDAILSLESHSAPQVPIYKPYDQDALNFIFSNSDKCAAFGMFDEERLVAWGAYRSDWNADNSQRGVFEISSLVVDRDYRNQGIGGKLLMYIIEQMKDKNAKKIYLTVSPLNISALVLYLKYGFVIYDYKKDVYGPSVDRLYLSLL